jgi:transposase
MHHLNCEIVRISTDLKKNKLAMENKLTMKNKMLKRSHLSEKTCREIIQLFSDDLTATQIASITGVSRVTINNYLKLIRTHIAKHCEEQNPDYGAKKSIPLVALPKINGTPLTNGEEAGTAYYGFYRFNGNIFTNGLYTINKSRIQELQRTRFINREENNGWGELVRYHAIADFDGWRLYRVDAGIAMNGKNHSDDIAVFWGNARSRLLKFRGLNKNTLYLHVKECEFRYNNRNDDINTILLNIITKHPLHLSKPHLSAARV